MRLRRYHDGAWDEADEAELQRILAGLPTQYYKPGIFEVWWEAAGYFAIAIMILCGSVVLAVQIGRWLGWIK
jgi:hypothetical protein